jgi:hypothetical protein
MNDADKYRERVARAVAKTLQTIEPSVRVDSLTTEEENRIADAAISAMMPFVSAARSWVSYRALTATMDFAP